MADAHSTNNYTIGRGILSIAVWSNGVIGSYADVGNCPSMEVTPTLERLDHFSSRDGYRVKDANPVIETGYTATFTLDEVGAADNLKKFVMGTMVNGKTIRGMQDINKTYALRLVEDNPAGPNKTWNFWKVTLMPSGALSLISAGTDWANMAFECEGLADTAGHSTSPYFTIDFASTTTTTTTTTI